MENKYIIIVVSRVKIDYKKLLFYICIPLVLGFIVGFLSGSFNGFSDINTPEFIPPRIAFPIVWSILYVLMGISRYLVRDDYDAVKSYNWQLGVNLLWSFLFFSFKRYWFAFLWLLFLIVLVGIMIYRFFKVSKAGAYIEIPYLLWILFAAFLNLQIALLN